MRGKPMNWKTARKIISVVVIITFIFTNTAYAAPSPRSFFKGRKVDRQKLSTQAEERLQKKKTIFKGEDAKRQKRYKKEARTVLTSHLKDLSQIHIPSELGRVTDVYEAPSKDARLIVHIQDLHTNPEAELNLAGILEILLKDYNMGLVCSEGADGEVDTSSVSSFPDYEVRERTARLFINSGELTGEEYLSITKYPELPIWGIEDRDIYFQNIIDFNKIMKFSPSSQIFISQAQKALNQLKTKIYSKELLAIDQKEVDYENETIETDEFLKNLSSYIRKFNIPTDNYKNISLLTEATEQEQKIDQIKVMQESQNLLLNLQATLSGKKKLRKDKDALMVKARLFRGEKISPFSFYSYLKDLALKHGVIASVAKQSKYPHLNEFLDYLTKVNSLDSTKLFTEMEDLTYEVKMRLARTKEQKTFIKALRNIKFLEGFFNLKVSNEELDYYLTNRDSHKVGFFKSFLKSSLKKYNISAFIDYNPSLIDTHLKELEVFYNVVKERDVAMVRNSISEIEKRDVKVASLIAGGFHTKGITKLLRDKGYSYIVVSPYSSTDIDEENYHFLLSGKRKPIEEIIKGLDLKEIVNRLSTSLRLGLGLDTDMAERWNKDLAPILAEILDIPVEEVYLEPFLDRIALPLGLQRGADVWENSPCGIQIKSPEKGLLTLKSKPEKGYATYLEITANNVKKIKSKEFKGKTVVNIVPKDKTIKIARKGMDPEIIRIENLIDKHSFLKKTIPSKLISRIKNDGTKQRMVINILDMLVSHYEWVISYANKPEHAEEKSEIIREVKKDIYKPIIDCLRKISIRIEKNELVPNAVTLKLSEKSKSDPKVNIDRKVKISYLPMKGDPWQIGHLWTILDLLADDSDIVVIMMDNSDPDRKPDLTALPIREADSQYLFDSLAPYVEYTEFQRERRPLLTVDGETTTPNLVYKNRNISDQVVWQYIAGYDHFNWTTEKGGKTLLDVPYKLFFDLTKLISGGIPVQLSARFNRRKGDSEDSPRQKQDKIKVIEALARLNLIHYYANSAISYVELNSKDETSKKAAIASIGRWKDSGRNKVLESLNLRQNSQLEEFYLDGEEALNLDDPVNAKVKAWFDRFKPATDWLEDNNFTDLQVEKLENALNANKPEALTEALSGFLNDTAMSFKVVDQPMDTSSTDVRNKGKLHTVPLSFAHSIIGLQRYDAFANELTRENDRIIATNVIALLIDLRSFDESDRVEEEVLKEHLGENLSNYVDIETLLAKVNGRLSNDLRQSIIFSEGNGKEQIRKLLSNAYGNALNTVDGYLMNFILKDDIFKLLLSTTGMNEEKAIEFINEVRDDLVQQRASEIVIKSRKEKLAQSQTSVEVPGKVVLAMGPHDTNWWEEATMEELRKNPTPWGEEAIIPVDKEKGRIKIEITREMLEDWSPVNPQGRNIESSFKKYEEVGPLAIAGIRHIMNILNPHDTRQVKNTFERFLTSLSLGLMLKIKYNKGAYFPYQANYGHEVRYHSEIFQDVTLQTLAAMGFVCHTVPDNEATAIWNTSTMGKFFNIPLSFCGTASHAESEIDGLKVMDYEGSQFLISDIEALIAIQRAIIEKIKRDGKVTFYLSAEDDPRITDGLYKSTHNGMHVYKNYQEKTAADDFVLDLINTLDPSNVHIDCMHGSGYKTLVAFFKEMGLEDLIDKIDWMHIEEKPDFGNIGKLRENPKTGVKEIFDLGADGTQLYEKVMPDGSVVKYFPVLCTADYPETLAAMPIGDIILPTDMDNDRLYYIQIMRNDAETKALLDEIGVVYNVVNNEKIAAVHIPNKSFHFLQDMNLERIKTLMDQGKVSKDRAIVILTTLASTPAVDQWAEAKAREGYNIKVINTAVGFAKLANVMYRTEGFMREHPGEDVIITDATGKNINIGHDPIILAAWEESGGIIVGITYGFKDLLGNSFLSAREKSATESIFLSLALISKLQKKGEVDFAKYLKEIYDSYDNDSPIDFRYDNKLFVPGTSKEAELEEIQGNKRKNRIFGAHTALAISKMRGDIDIDECRRILKDMFIQEYEARNTQVKNKLPDVLIERFKEVDFDYLEDVWFCGDGVMFVFEKEGRKWFVLFRPSGTEPKLKAYAFGKDAERLSIDGWVFAFNENTHGYLPGSFTKNKHLMEIWGEDGVKAVDKGRRMQGAWEDYGLVIDPEDLDEAQLQDLQKRKLVRTFTPPDNHIELVNDWLKDQGLPEVNIPSNINYEDPPAMPQEAIVDLLEAVPADIYENLGSKKEDVLRNETLPTPEIFMQDLKFLMDMAGLGEHKRTLSILKNCLDAVSFVETLMEASGKEEEEVLNVLMVIPALRVKALKYKVIKAKREKKLDPDESLSRYLRVDVDSLGSSIAIGSDIQELKSGRVLFDFLLEQFKLAKDTPFAYRDDMIFYVGRLLGLIKGDKPEHFKQKKINQQELSDLLERIDGLKGFLKEGLDLSEIKYIIINGIGANEMYLHQLEKDINQLAKALGIKDFRVIVVNNASDIDRVLKDCKDATTENTLEIDMSRSGGTAEPVGFMEMTCKKDGPLYINKRIVWANGKKMHKLGEKLSKEDESSLVLHIDNTPGNIGGRHMNLNTDMVYTPLFTMLAILGRKISDNNEEDALNWATGELKVYVRNLYEANLALSPKESSEPVENPASQMSIEIVRKRDVEGREKLPMIFDPGLRDFATEHFQNMNEGAAKPAQGEVRNNNMLSFWDASKRDILDYIAVIKANPELYQSLFIVDLSSEYAGKMLQEIEELKNIGVPVQVVTLDLKKIESNDTLDDIKREFEHNLAVQARATALLQTVVTTFTHLTDQDANSNPAVKMTREVTAAIETILAERQIAAGDKPLTRGQKRITFGEIDRKMKETQESDRVGARKDLASKIKEVSEKGTVELPAVFQEFVDKALKPLAIALGKDEKVVVALFIRAISRLGFSADMAESGGLKAALMDVVLESVGFGSELGRSTKDFKLVPLSNQVDVYKDTEKGIMISFACPEDLSGEQKDSYKDKTRKNLPKAIAQYYIDRFEEENRLNTLSTFGVAHVEPDSKDKNVNKIMAEINNLLQEFGINHLAMNFPRIAHTGIEAAQALAEIIAIIGLIPEESFPEGKGQIGNIEIRKGLTINGTSKIYILSNLARMALGGSPTVVFEYKNKEQLAEIKEIMLEALGILAEQLESSPRREIRSLGTAAERITKEILDDPGLSWKDWTGTLLNKKMDQNFGALSRRGEVKIYYTDRTKALIESKFFEEGSAEEVLERFLGTIEEGDYVYLSPYILGSPELQNAFSDIGVLLKDNHHEHPDTLFRTESGNQLNNLTDEAVVVVFTFARPYSGDRLVPGKNYSLWQENMAHALGIVGALEEKGRRVIRIHLSDGFRKNPEKLIKALFERATFAPVEREVKELTADLVQAEDSISRTSISEAILTKIPKGKNLEPVTSVFLRLLEYTKEQSITPAQVRLFNATAMNGLSKMDVRKEATPVLLELWEDRDNLAPVVRLCIMQDLSAIGLVNDKVKTALEQGTRDSNEKVQQAARRGLLEPHEPLDDIIVFSAKRVADMGRVEFLDKIEKYKERGKLVEIIAMNVDEYIPIRHIKDSVDMIKIVDGPGVEKLDLKKEGKKVQILKLSKEEGGNLKAKLLYYKDGMNLGSALRIMDKELLEVIASGV